MYTTRRRRHTKSVKSISRIGILGNLFSKTLHKKPKSNFTRIIQNRLQKYHLCNSGSPFPIKTGHEKSIFTGHSPSMRILTFESLTTVTSVRCPIDASFLLCPWPIVLTQRPAVKAFKKQILKLSVDLVFKTTFFCSRKIFAQTEFQYIPQL